MQGVEGQEGGRGCACHQRARPPQLDRATSTRARDAAVNFGLDQLELPVHSACSKCASVTLQRDGCSIRWRLAGAANPLGSLLEVGGGGGWKEGGKASCRNQRRSVQVWAECSELDGVECMGC